MSEHVDSMAAIIKQLQNAATTFCDTLAAGMLVALPNMSEFAPIAAFEKTLTEEFLSWETMEISSMST